MSATRATVRGRIQEILGDVNPSERVVNQFRLDETIGRNMHLIAGRAMMPRDSVTSVALVASTYDYSLSASLTYQMVEQVLLDSTGREIAFVPFAQFNAYYRQDTAQPIGTGTPQEYTLYETTTNILKIRFGPTPSASDTAKVHAAAVPALLTADSSVIPFAHTLIRGLESACAAEIVLALSDEALGRLGLSRGVARKWSADAEGAIHDYNVRQRRMGAQQNHILRGGGRRLRAGI